MGIDSTERARQADAPVFLESTGHAEQRPGELSGAGERVSEFHGDVSAALAWAAEIGRLAPKPGGGRTRQLWELLASTAAADVGVARILEPHLDALAILDQAPQPVGLDAIGVDARSTWGVYAAEGPGAPLVAGRGGGGHNGGGHSGGGHSGVGHSGVGHSGGSEFGVGVGGGWLLDGVKPWCSLARDVSHALVTASTGDGMRRLFAVKLCQPGVDAADGPWVSRGLRQVVSAPVRFTAVPAVPVGDDQWYLKRPGFAWGGIGVAACWWGGAVGVARSLASGVLHSEARHSEARRREPDQIALAHLGAVDTAVNAARATLAEAARFVDDPDLSTDEPAIIARRVRNLVAGTVETTLMHAAHGLGPAPLALDEEHARRVADLQIYVRQHHAERDEASLGRDLAARGRQPW